MTVANFTKDYINLASPRIGAEAISCSDDFFAPMQRLLNEAEPVFIEDEYDEHGKWMDGWESRRKRTKGNDWCIVKLGVRGQIKGVEIDTSFFTGNFPPHASIDGAYIDGTVDANTVWKSLLDRVSLEGDKKHWFPITDENHYSHVRLNIFPDGGVARLRVYGEPNVSWGEMLVDKAEVNLAALELGAKAIAWSDAHYGDPNKMFSPAKSENMGDGWETRRRREAGNDWLVFKLAHRGNIEKIIVDTAFFKGNYPDGFSLRAIRSIDTLDMKTLEQDSANWPILLEREKLSADSEREFSPSSALGTVSYVRVDIYPDGGISRLKLLGKVSG